MIDIDKQLQKIELKTIKPDDILVNKTKTRMKRIIRKQDKSNRKVFWRTMAVAIPAAAALVVVAVLLMFSSRGGTPMLADSVYYTIDINPSIVLEVDDSDRIISIAARNEDALDLMGNIQCLGMDIREAIPLIISEAKKLGYITEDQDNYVLIARFGEENGHLSESEINSIVSDVTGGEAHVLYLIGSLEDKAEAELKGKSAGIYLLEKHAKEQGITPEDFEPDEQEGSLKEDMEAIELPVCNIEAAISNGVLILEWDMIEHDEFSGYKLVSSKTNPNPQYPDDGYLDYITDRETTRIEISEGFAGLKGGETYWFSITALFKGGFTSNGNSVQAEIPVKIEPSPSPEPTPEPSAAPTQTPTPTPVPSLTPAPKVASAISGSAKEAGIELSWEKIVHSEFNGYKVVASKTNPNPKYPEDGYLKYITNADVTSKTFSYENFEPGVDYWFSITVLYKDGSKAAGNAVKIKIPIYESESGSASEMNGYVEGDYVILNWDEIDSDLFQGYKVVASESNPNPVYPADGYIKYITDKSTTQLAVSQGFGGLKGGTSFYFSITVLYKDGQKIPGNSIYLTVPDSVPDNNGNATEISGEVAGDYVILHWDMINNPAFQGYKVVASRSNPNPAYPADGYIKYITNPGSTGLSVYEGFNGLKGGTGYYFSITVLYSDGSKIPGNSVYLIVPDSEQVSDMGPANLLGEAGSDSVYLTWNKINHPQFAGYKVVASKTNQNPSYPEDGYLKYITDPDQTFFTSAFNNFSGGTWWFSITVLYSDGTKVPGNAVAIEIPEGEGLPEAEIFGVIIEDNVVLEWNVIEHDLFQGYKVVASKTNPNPKYPEDGYLVYKTTYTDTRYESPASNFSSGTWWFSITVLYSDGTKVPGNSVQLEIP